MKETARKYKPILRQGSMFNMGDNIQSKYQNFDRNGEGNYCELVGIVKNS